MPDRRARRHAETRAEILDAAWRLSREQGLTGWALRDVAAAVDMRAPSLYGYFDGKHAIYDAMYAQGYRDLLARAESDWGTSSPADTLRRTARGFLEFCVEDAARFQLLFLRTIPDFEPSDESYALAVRALERLRAVLAAAGLDDPETVDLWTAALTGLAAQQLSNEPGGDRWTRLVDRAVDGLLTRS